jgi:hypothetical protein
LFEHLRDFFYLEIGRILTGDITTQTLLAVMERFSLETVTDKWSAKACKRLAQCFGLPKDGHVVHTLVQGHDRFNAAGPNADAQVEVVPDTESAWDMASHRCGVWLLATSSAGKDNALAIVKAIRKHLKAQPEFRQLTIFNELEICRLTYQGLLEQLDEGTSPNKKFHWLTWLNSEIKQCFGKGQNDIQEADFCQAAEGVAIGKRASTLVSKHSTPKHIQFVLSSVVFY